MDYEIDYKEAYEELVRILKRNIVLDENYSTDSNGSTKAYKMTIENCVSFEEDENYTDDCFPNIDFDKIEYILNEE